MSEQLIMIFHHTKKAETCDIEVPSNLTAIELVSALNDGFDLGIDLKDMTQCYMKTTNPIVLLKGNKTLLEFGLHQGTHIWFDR